MTTDDRRDRGRDDDDNGAVYMPRDKAAEYLSRRLGRPITAGALKKMAHRGRGPAFAVIMHRASYTKRDLDEWLAGPDAQRKHGGWRPRKSD